MTRVDPELGVVRLCRRCGEEWPLDQEFWYLTRGKVSGGMCRACWSESRMTTTPWYLRPDEPRRAVVVVDDRSYSRRDLAMLYALDRTAGNMSQAARDEGVTVSFVSHAIRRLAERGHPDAGYYRHRPVAVSA